MSTANTRLYVLAISINAFDAILPTSLFRHCDSPQEKLMRVEYLKAHTMMPVPAAELAGDGNGDGDADGDGIL